MADKKCYIAGVGEWIVGYVFAETRGKAQSMAWRNAKNLEDVEFLDVYVWRCKLLDKHSRLFAMGSGCIESTFDNRTTRILRRLGLAKYDKTERHYTYSCKVMP